MKPVDEEEYRSFVAVRLKPLRRMAFLLCRDWHTADDLVSVTIGKLYRPYPNPPAGWRTARFTRSDQR